MTTVRPNPVIRQDVDMEQEQTLEMTVVLAKLTQLNESVGKLSDKQDYLKVMLLGGEYGEIRHDGKLPLLEKDIALIRAEAVLVTARVMVLEEDKKTAAAEKRIAMKFASVIASVIGAAVGTLFTVGTQVVIEYLRRGAVTGR